MYEDALVWCLCTMGQGKGPSTGQQWRAALHTRKLTMANKYTWVPCGCLFAMVNILLRMTGLP